MARRLLSVLTAAATLGAVVLTSQAAEASVAPRAAFTSFTIEVPRGTLLTPATKAYTGAAASVTPIEDGLIFSGDNGAWTVGVAGPTDGDLEVGGRPTSNDVSAGAVELDVIGGGGMCAGPPGWILVHEISRTLQGDITSFAATYSKLCAGYPSAIVGELRYNSTVDYERFGTLGLGKDSLPRTVTVSAAVQTTFGTAAVEGPDRAAFRVTQDTCSGATVAAGATCTLKVWAHPRAVGGSAASLLIPAPVARVVGLTTIGVDTPEGAYTPLTPGRVLDTRKATGVTTTTPIGAGKFVDVQVTGKRGVPSSGVAAVVLNVTAISPTRQGYLTVYPSTVSRPKASSVNFGAGWVGANLVTVPIGSGGKVRVHNAAGSTHVAADVVGYYHSAASTASVASSSLVDYAGFEPYRGVDTRTAEWGKTPLPGQNYLWQAFDFGDEYNSRIKAYAVNVTVVKPSRQGHLTAFDGGTSIPSTSTLNFTAGRTVPNMAIIKSSPCGSDCDAGGEQFPRFGIYNASLGSAHVVVDVVGVYFKGQPGDWGWRFRSLPTPKRFVDSREAQGLATNLGSNRSAAVVTPSSIAGYNTMGVVTNTTAAEPSSTTVFTLWANDGSTRPTVSNLNPYAGQVVSNMTITPVGGNNDFRIHNLAGTAPVVIDAAGTMEYYPALVPGDSFDAPSAVARADGPTDGTKLSPRAAGRDRVAAR